MDCSALRDSGSKENERVRTVASREPKRPMLLEPVHHPACSVYMGIFFVCKVPCVISLCESAETRDISSHKCGTRRPHPMENEERENGGRSSETLHFIDEGEDFML